MAFPVILNKSKSASGSEIQRASIGFHTDKMIEKSDSAQFHLSLIRTELSNSRTMLAHTQAFVGLLISGIGVSKFLDSSWIFDVCGMIFALIAFAVLFRGVILYRRTSSLIQMEKDSVSGL